MQRVATLKICLNHISFKFTFEYWHVNWTTWLLYEPDISKKLGQELPVVPTAVAVIPKFVYKFFFLLHSH